MKINIVGGGPAGLYFAILMKKADPAHEITLFERNPADVTWGWGVVFSDETLEGFREADRQTYLNITSSFVRWEAIDIHFKDKVIRSGGHVFYGIRRMKLLGILQERCRDLGVELKFGHEIESIDQLPDADLIVGADGINSRIRAQFAEHFRPDVAIGKSKYIWLASSRVFKSFLFIIRENAHGLFQVHAYPFDKNMSTFIVETDEDSWRKAGLDNASESESVGYCEKLFAGELNGERLLSNNSTWINFRRIKNETWHYRNIVLIGDAAHTAHFSIGSGTKLAMEDSISLTNALRKAPSVQSGIAMFQEGRWLDVAKLQRAADVSQQWFEDIKRWKNYEPDQFGIKLLCRSKRITHENLRVRDPQYIEHVDRWFASRNGCEGFEPPPPPMFTPFQLRGMKLKNRVVVSPMCQYSAEDGMPNDWHLVHLGSRAIGGAAIVMVEMTDVSREARISPGCTGMYRPEHVSAWKRITDFVHAHSAAKIGMQLAHAGRKGSTKLIWEGDNEPLPSGNWPLISASPIPWSLENQIPKEMDRSDMDVVVKEFVRATFMAEEAGFDLLELQMAHGYLLSSFLSPLTNRREDEYGGSMENRMRFPLEVFDAVRLSWPAPKPISVRISATDWVSRGLQPVDSVVIASMFRAHGCDIIDVSSGQTTTMAQPIYGRMYQAPFSDRIRNEVRIPTMTVGNIKTWDQVNTLIVTGQADLVVLARQHLYDPYFTLHAAADQEYEDVDWPVQYRSAAPTRRKG